MCECGCTSNDVRLWFPAPQSDLYILTLSRGCVDCDGPSGVTIERVSKKDFKKYHAEFSDGELEFQKWPDSYGVAIVTGMLKHEFVKALSPSFVGTEIEMDEIGVEVLLEEAYEDSVVKPFVVAPQPRSQ